MIRNYNMKKLLALFLAAIISLMPLSFAASADATAPVVELALAEDGTITDIAGSGATEISWSNSAVPQAAYGSFKNKSGDMTGYLQFGTDPDGDGIYAVGNSNWLEIQNSAMNGLSASTMSFWMRLEEAASIYRPYALYAKKSTDGEYVRGAASAGQSGWLIADYSANATAYELKGASVTEAKNSMWGATDTWTNNWVHMVVTRTYDAGAKVSTINWYINGGLNPTVTTKVNGELSDESGHVYALGSSRVAQYSGIKLYNTEMAANVIYAAEKDLYEEYVETEMLLLSPTEDGSLTKTSGKLNLQFNCAVNESTLSGVTLKKAGSEENMLGAYTLGGGKKTVSFSYGGLEVGGEYILSVSGVESDKGLTMPAPVALTYIVLPDPSLKVNAEFHADGSVTNKTEGQSTRFSYTAGAPSAGSFMNEAGGTTDYLQFGGNETYLEVYDADMNGQTATTVSFWIRIENTGAKYRPIVLYGTDADNYTNVSTGNEYLIPDYNPLMFVLRGSAFSDAYQGGTTWGNVWSHMVLTRVYDEATGKWTVTWYRNGSKLQSRTVSGALPDESNYVYVFGGERTAKYSGIKLYNDEMSASTLYNNEKALYEALPDSMELVSVEPVSGLSQSGGEITITFNNYVDEDAISDITLTNGDGTPINGRYLVYMPEKRSKVVKLRYGELEEEGTYLLEIPASVASINGYMLGETEPIEYACISNVIFHEDFEALEEGGVAYIEGLTPYSLATGNAWEAFEICTDAETGRN
ncbi:MAG: hypothetical protein IKL80_04325, partial [Clostridia bacterium]|nr:hypothetical protein [Clostridia bacterium]